MRCKEERKTAVVTLADASYMTSLQDKQEKMTPEAKINPVVAR